MKFICILFFLFLSIQIENNQYAVVLRRPTENSIQIPQYLFHWRSKYLLDALFKKIKPKYGIVQQWPNLNLQFKDALFAWSHPVGGMRYSGNNELYAGPIESQDLQMIVLKIDPKSSVLNLASIYQKNQGQSSTTLSIDSYDFIFHQVYNSDGNLRYQEWIVLNPQKITSMISDPRHYPESVLSELRLALKPDYKLEDDQKISPTNNIERYEKIKIQQLLQPDFKQCKNLFQ